MKEFIIKDYPDTFNVISDCDISMRIDPQSSLSDVLESFERFLKACGYCFDGHLDIVNDDIDDQSADTDL